MFALTCQDGFQNRHKGYRKYNNTFHSSSTEKADSFDRRPKCVEVEVFREMFSEFPGTVACATEIRSIQLTESPKGIEMQLKFILEKQP